MRNSTGYGLKQVLESQWANPADVSTILMVIGGDVVQNALAQGTGVWYFTPVCFSFGWVSYAFMALISIIGDGRLLPRPDYTVKVFNLKSGHTRENKNWVVGRILRDLESSLSEAEPLDDDAIRISVFEAAPNSYGHTHFSVGRIHLMGMFFIMVQFGLAIVPIFTTGEWDIMMITAAGTLLVQIAGCLPQWRAEKLPNRQGKDDVYALTQGNGSREIIIIFGNGNCLDLEELSSSETPRGGRPWEKFTSFWGLLSKPRTNEADLPRIPQREAQLRKARLSWGLPRGFLITVVVVIVQSVLWLLLLVNVVTPRDSSWFLLAIGAVGMFQNAYLAGMGRPSEQRNLPLARIETIRAKKVMDGIMDFEVQYKDKVKGWECAVPLRNEYFPGKLQDPEEQWWAGDKNPYDTQRENHQWRGKARSRQRSLPMVSMLPETTGLANRIQYPTRPVSPPEKSCNPPALGIPIDEKNIEIPYNCKIISKPSNDGMTLRGITGASPRVTSGRPEYLEGTDTGHHDGAGRTQTEDHGDVA